MAITRLWQAGFETRSYDEFTYGIKAIVGTQVRTGAWSERLSTASGNQIDRHIRQDIDSLPAIGSPTKQIRAAGAFWFDALGSTDGDVIVMMTGTSQLLKIQTIGGTTNLQLIVDGVQQDTTSDSPLAEDTWFHIAIDCKIDAAAGWAYVYLNGDSTPIMSFDGDTGGVNIDNVIYGPYTTYVTGGGYWYIDDLYIDDTTSEGAATVCPIPRFYYLTPNANGNYAQWLGSDGNSANNYQLVDEAPPNTTDYVAVGTGGYFDSYGVSTFTLGAGQTIKAMIPYAYTQRYGVGERLSLGTRYSGSDLIGSAQDPGWGGWNYLWERQTGTPIGGGWNQTSLDAVEAVIYSTGTFS